MATRGSFQKRQKEAARREKRQLKLDRRQGRVTPGTATQNQNPDEANPDAVNPDDTTPASTEDSPLEKPAEHSPIGGQQ